MDNIPRVLPSGLGARVDVNNWELPGVFKWLMTQGGVSPKEMCRTFNCGMGMVLVVGREDVESVLKVLRDCSEDVVKMGGLFAGEGVEMVGLETWE